MITIRASWRVEQLEPKSETSFIAENSTAAEDMETAPREIPVSLRTLLPAETAVFSNLESTFCRNLSTI